MSAASLLFCLAVGSAEAATPNTGGYPRVTHKGNETCIEVMDEAGRVSETCRTQWSVPLSAAPATGANLNVETAPADKREHVFSLTVSPFHAFVQMGEVTGELRADDQLGIAAVLGAGFFGGFTLLEGGGQLRYYPLGSFDGGLQLGAEVLALSASNPSNTFTGVTVSPFVGAKIASDVGLTAEFQAGPSFATLAARGENSLLLNLLVGGNRVGLMANLNIGWSF